jgi:hypothetical protein
MALVRRICKICLADLDLESFYQKRGGHDSICKDCKKRDRRSRYQPKAKVIPPTPEQQSTPSPTPDLTVTPADLQLLVDVFSTLGKWRDDLKTKPEPQPDDSRTESSNLIVDPNKKTN